MGNENSRLKGLVIDKTAVEANDFWALHNAEMPTTTNDEGRQYLSIFQEEPVVNGQLWVAQGPLERAIKNLMIYRHPYILKYVTTWEQGGQKHLATERVRPLAAVLTHQTDLQICLGLRTILCSLIFLTEKAMARHLNISIQSIYITDNGSWRLAGFEYVWKVKDINKTILDRAKAFRYKNAIDSDEEKDEHMATIEQYAFGTLCEEILEKFTKALQAKTPTPHIQEFSEYCTTHLKHKNAQMRPKLSAILLHPYFNHEFVLIHSFLFELPLKNLYEKQDFFTGLIGRLSYFDEEVVAAQLARDLLSRMVLLDPTAQLCVTPCVLRTKSDHAAALFSPSTYKRHLVPHILKMFRLRDAQIRLILLEYFMEYVRLLSDLEIEEQILPHLLAGMNDTNDVLVAKTLRCMADLIPILGANAVVGGQRLKLFSDGRPQAALPDSTSHWVEPRSITPVMTSGNTIDYMVSGSPLPDHADSSSNSSASLPGMTAVDLDLPTRLSPDGGEDIKSVPNTDNLTSLIAKTDLKPTTPILSSYPTSPLSLKSCKTEKADTVSSSPVKVASDETVTAAKLEEINSHVAHDEEEEWSDWETDGQTTVVREASIPTTQLYDKENIPAVAKIGNSVDAESTSSFATIPSQISLTDSFRTAPSNASSAQSLKPTKPSSVIDDLTAFDIQVQLVHATKQANSSDFDFFKDMEPVIKTNVLSVPLDMAQDTFGTDLAPMSKTTGIAESVHIDSNRFAAITDDANALITTMDGGDGWNVSDEDNDDDDAMLSNT